MGKNASSYIRRLRGDTVEDVTMRDAARGHFPGVTANITTNPQKDFRGFVYTNPDKLLAAFLDAESRERGHVNSEISLGEPESVHL